MASVNSTAIRVQSGANTEAVTGTGVLVGNTSKVSLNGYNTVTLTIGNYGSSYTHEITRICFSTTYTYNTLRTQGTLTAAVNWSESNLSNYCEHVTGASGTGDKSITVSSLTSSYYMVFMTTNSRLINITKILLKT